MLLKELSNSPYSFSHREEQHNSESKSEMYRFHTDDTEYETAVDVNENGKFFEVRFRAKPYHQDEINLNDKWSDEITGTGNSIKVFSTILAIIKHAMKLNPDVKGMLFGSKAEEPSRVSLYLRFVDNLERYLPGWKLKKIRKQSKDYIYFLEKK